MHTIFLLLSLWTSLSTPVVPAVEGPDAKVLSCAGQEINEAFAKVDSGFARQQDSLREAWAVAVNNRRDKALSPPPFRIPVVFHLIHQNGAENISDTDIIRSLDFLNQSFANTDYYDQGTGVSTGIQFCLAQRTPDNQTTDGITRTVSPLTNLNTDDDLQLKDLSRWPSREYLNIWVVKEICGLGLGCGVAGYAYYPGAHGGPRDGIVVEARHLTSNEARASVLTHEAGHYLGLRHTFNGGCLNDDCTRNGDGICDTPPDQSKVAVPCSGSVNSCTTDTNSGFATDQNDMFINYMDYGYWSCYSAFTAGQRDRMQFNLEGIRRSLQESKGCAPPCPALVTAGFSGGNITVEVGTTVNFTNSSSNGTAYVWRENSTTFSTVTDASRTFSTEGTFRIRLVAESGSPLCYPDSTEQIVTVVCSVTASFSLPSQSVVVDSTVTFVNTSSSGTSRQWTVNGAAAGTGTNLDQAFTAPGVYTVCLRETNGACERDFCRVLFVRTPPCTEDCPGSEACTEPFAFLYQQPGGTNQGNNTFSAVLPVNDVFIVAGHASFFTAPFLMSLNAEGIPQWQTQLFPSADQGAFITRLFLDSEGFIVGTGFSVQSNVHYEQLAFRVDPTDGRVLWAQQYAAPEEAWSPLLLSEPIAGGDYHILGRLTQNADASQHHYRLQLDRNTGLIINQPTKYSLTGNITPEDGVIDTLNDQFYTIASIGGTSSGNNEALVSAFSTTTGSEQWSRNFSLPQGRTLSGKSLLVENGSIVCAGQPTIIQVVGSDRINLWSFGGDEGLDLSREFFLPESVIVHDLLRNGLGYLLFLEATADNRIILLQLDTRGNVLWCKRYSTTLDKVVADQVWTADNFILVAAQEGSSPILLRLTAAGDPVGACLTATDIPVEAFDQVLENGSLQLNPSMESLQTSQFFFEPGFFQRSPESCLPDCPEVPEEEGCAPPFSFNFTDREVQTAGSFTAVLPYAGGHLLGGTWGNSQGIISIDSAGDILWQQQLAGSSFGSSVTQIILDADGLLAGVGTLDDGFNLFRMNPMDGSLLWSQAYVGNSTRWKINKIIHPGAGREYQLFGQSEANSTPSASANGIVLSASPLTGLLNTTASWSFAGGGSESFEDAIHDPTTDTYYVIGQLADPTTLSSGFLLQFDAGMQPLWIRRLNKSSNLSSATIPISIDQDQDTLLILSQQINPGNSQVSELWKTTTNGDFLEGYDLQGGLLNLPEKVRVGTSGYYLSGYDDNTGVRQIIHLDRAGGFRWGQGFPSQRNVLAGREGMVLTTNSVLYAQTTASGTELNLLQLGLDGRAPDCSEVFPTTVEAAAFRGQLPRVSFNRSPVSGSSTSVGWRPGQLVRTTGCLLECDETEICDNQIDDDNDGLTDCDDPDLAFSCCCLASPSLSLGPDTTVCPGFILGEGTSREFSSYAWSTGETADSITIVSAGTYWLMVTDSCGNTATDTLTLHLRPRPLLDLGPDTVLCSNAVVPFLAQDGFADYRWVDGSTEKLFTAYDPGTYWVIATDSCGNVTTDTVRVNILPATEIDLGNDTTICRGDTLAFQLSGFTDYQWSQSSFLDCDDCPEVRFSPTQDTLLLVAARLNANCFSSDSIRVRVNQVAGTRTSQSICAGDSLAFGGQMVGQAGQYFTQADQGNCLVTDTLDVIVLDTFATSEAVVLCAGDSIQLFGSFRQDAGTYARTFTSSNGCDSIHRVTLTLRDSIVSRETRTLCAGDSVLIFGVFATDPGTYQQSFTAAGGCDSTHQILLEVTDLDASAAQLRPVCGAVAGAGEVFYNEQAGSVLIRWPDGTLGPTNENLAAGDYTITLTASGGCAAEVNLNIARNPLPEISLATTPETCPGENDGTLLINGFAGASYRLEAGGAQTDNTFTSLAPGDYRLTVSDSLGCTDELTVSIDPAQAILLDLPESLTISLGDSVLLTPQTNLPAEQINWQSTLGDTCSACPLFTLRPPVSTVVVATAIDSNGCIAVAETNIMVRKDDLFYVPNAFSPNGDGVNDVFRIYPGPAVEQVLSVAVFDRWGNQAYLGEPPVTAGTPLGWDGRSVNGKIAGVGVYVYVVEVRLFTGQVVRQAGEVLVLR